jgi:hypothetical protein
MIQGASENLEPVRYIGWVLRTRAWDTTAASKDWREEKRDWKRKLLTLVWHPHPHIHTYIYIPDGMLHDGVYRKRHISQPLACVAAKRNKQDERLVDRWAGGRISLPA